MIKILGLGWEHIAHPVAGEGDPRLFVNDMPGGGRLARLAPALASVRSRICLEGKEGRRIIAFSEEIKAAKQARGLTLVQTAREAGISAALLSRLERGQVAKSQVFRLDAPIDGADWPVLVILNPWLDRLCNVA